MFIQFEGIDLFRDIGGVVTRNGRSVKKGMIYSSSYLSNATEHDWDILINDLNIQYIIDYRNDLEVKINPEINQSSIENKRISAIFGKGIFDIFSEEEIEFEQIAKKLTVENFEKLYQRLPINNIAYKEMVRQLRKEKVPLIQCSTAGIDRTGVGSFIIYLILDVKVDVIANDLVNSNSHFTHSPPKWEAELKPFLKDEEQLSAIKGVLSNYVFFIYDSILNQYDTIEDYLLEEFEIDFTERKRLQDLFLE